MNQLRTRISHGEEGRVGGRQHKLMWPVYYTYQRHDSFSLPLIGTETAETKWIGEVKVLFVNPKLFIRTRVGV